MRQTIENLQKNVHLPFNQAMVTHSIILFTDFTEIKYVGTSYHSNATNCRAFLTYQKKRSGYLLL